MNFLNEVTLRYPRAISFGPGRPPDVALAPEEYLADIARFVDLYARQRGLTTRGAWQDLAQYNRTNGIINDLIAEHLLRDEAIRTTPDGVMVTVGAQEAMTVLLMGLFEPGRDVLLVSDPTYIGVTGAAAILGIRTIPVPVDEQGLDPSVVEEYIERVVAEGGRPRALYDVPNFSNPLGSTLSIERRHQLLSVCHTHGVLILEDNPYGLFAYDAPPPPTLKALDTHGDVIYIGSFAKTVCPGVRVGYLVADQVIDEAGQTLATELSKIKSLVTVNTPSTSQALIGGVLLRSGCSLRDVVADRVRAVHRKRDRLHEALIEVFGRSSSVRWQPPAGGFFQTVTLPFEFGDEELRACASDRAVIVAPMRYFSLQRGQERRVRLSFSAIRDDDIVTGIERFGAFVESREAEVGTRVSTARA